jgi:CDP-diacylglycerol pyrophosphatase
LWRVVRLCVVDLRLTGRPAPCFKVDTRRGYAVIRDPGHATQVLLVPTVRIAGIESPRLLAEGAFNFWQAAWEARTWFERRADAEAPREDIALAINSIHGRTQDQLHIHIDCVRREVKAALARAGIGTDWGELSRPLAGQRYYVRRLEGETLSDRDPFRLLADSVPGARSHMRDETMAVVGARFADGAPGFYLLAARGGTAANPRGAAEDLMDHNCLVLGER